jgi:hypothetical protein
MRGALGDALRKAGVREPEIGGKLTVTFTHSEPPDRPGLSASKHFKAEYVPASPAAAGSFFGNGDGVSGQTGTVLDGVQQQVVAPPVRPPAISEAAWNAMDDNTRRAVAKTMSVPADDGPPF